MQMMVEAPPKRYSRTEIRQRVGVYRNGEMVPDSTFRYWCAQLGVVQDETGNYTEDDLAIFIGLVDWLSVPGQNISNYRNKIYEDLEHATRQESRTEPEPKAVWLPAEIEWCE